MSSRAHNHAHDYIRVESIGDVRCPRIAKPHRQCAPRHIARIAVRFDADFAKGRRCAERPERDGQQALLEVVEGGAQYSGRAIERVQARAERDNEAAELRVGWHKVGVVADANPKRTIPVGARS